ncbi:hypothetical protein BH24ACT5_BH24ACT5_07670 [soil metagenome]
MNDPRLLDLFARQFGVVSIRQLRECGAAPRTISRACHGGVLHHVLPSVVLLNGYRLTFEARAMAALLHAGPTAFLDGRSAAAVHGLRSMPRSIVEVTLTARRNLVAPGWMHLVRDPHAGAADAVEHPSGLRVAEPRRMLLTLAATDGPRRFEGAAEDAWHLGLVTPSVMSDYIAAARGRPGGDVVDRWLATAAHQTRPSQSGLEMEALAAIRKAGLPEPLRQYALTLPDGRTIHLDLAWPDRRLAVEPGHSWWHGGNERMAADYARDRACGELGWHVVRFDESMRHDLTGTGRQIKRIYDARLTGPAS